MYKRQAVSHLRQILGGISLLVSKREDELYTFAKEYRVSYDIVKYVHDNKKLPVLNFSAGGVATPQDAALMRRDVYKRQHLRYNNTFFASANGSR